MLDILRKNTRSFAVYLMFSIIIVVFVFTFNTITPDQACGSGAQQQLLAKLYTVGDQTIDTNWLHLSQNLSLEPPTPGDESLRAMEQRYIYRSTRFRLFQSFGFAYESPYRDFVAVNPLKTSDLHLEKSMQDLVESLLVGQEARRIGLGVSDQELTDKLLGSYWYDEDSGEFQAKSYDRMVRFQLGVSPTRFEHLVRMELLRDKLITLLVGGMRLTDAELSFHQIMEEEKVNLEYIKVDESAISALITHKPEAIVEYLGKEANVAQVKAYYDSHSSEYHRNEQVQVRGIYFQAPNRGLIGLEKDAAEKETMLGNRQEQYDAAVKVRTGFQVAQEADNDKPKAEENGEPKPDEDAVDAPQPPLFIPVDAFAKVASEKTNHENSKELGGLFDEPRDFQAMTRWPFGPEAADVIFTLAVGQVSEVIEVDTGFWLLRIEKKLPAQSRSLEDSQNGIAETLLTQSMLPAKKKEVAALIYAEAQKDAVDTPLEDLLATLSQNPADGLQGHQLKVEETGEFARFDLGAYSPVGEEELGKIPNLGLIKGLSKSVFALSEALPLLDKLVQTEDGQDYLVVRLRKKIEAPSLDESIREDMRLKLLRDRQKLFYRAWYQGILARATEAGQVASTTEWDNRLDEARKAFDERYGALDKDAASVEQAAIPTDTEPTPAAP